MKRMMKNELTGQTKVVKIGFSWTMLFFGVFVPLLRGDFKWALLSLLFNLLTFGIFGLVFCFKYNEIYANDLMEKGYKFV